MIRQSRSPATAIKRYIAHNVVDALPVGTQHDAARQLHDNAVQEEIYAVSDHSAQQNREAQISHATRLLFQRMKLVVEPSGALALACLIKRPQHLAGKRIGIILSGGNVDLENLPW